MNLTLAPLDGASIKNILEKFFSSPFSQDSSICTDRHMHYTESPIVCQECLLTYTTLRRLSKHSSWWKIDASCLPAWNLSSSLLLSSPLFSLSVVNYGLQTPTVQVIITSQRIAPRTNTRPNSWAICKRQPTSVWKWSVSPTQLLTWTWDSSLPLYSALSFFPAMHFPSKILQIHMKHESPSVSCSTHKNQPAKFCLASGRAHAWKIPTPYFLCQHGFWKHSILLSNLIFGPSMFNELSIPNLRYSLPHFYFLIFRQY